MAHFDEIDEARKLLRLGEAATLKEIKSTYRRLAHRHHPDKHIVASEEHMQRMRQLNQAYKVLTEYCDDYRYTFREEDVTRTYPDEEDWRKWQERWRI